MTALAERARAALDPVHWDFFAGGAGEERTLRANEEAFSRRRIVPRVLRGVGDRDLSTELFGTRLSMPVLVAPTAFHRLAHPAGEVGTAGAVAASDTVMVVSMAATQPVEDITATGAAVWFQLYPQPDDEFQRHVVKRAEAAGCRALVVTVDSPVFGRRERDRRNGFDDLPDGYTCENMRDGEGRVREIGFDPTLGWEHVHRLRASTGLPIVLKGVLHPADARLAVEHGVDGLIVSNHGGRQLDGAIATVDALPAIVRAVDGRIPVLVDGGVRRGADIAVALALGATAVLIGRPIIWGLAAGGPSGVRDVLEAFRDELDHVLTLAGAARPSDLTADQVA
ncbi:alpha-hydroxy-acid oxidizing protein [Actinoplanes sp. LDG1-06]|uniref:Alpha-hydroxy-acid oxidizing protein n=1 Tax=Paractinoplanes ovalisporus TaxID=2810368 RepID=A0ABS2AI82_9ACTN|nr:alpha-hydroxy acid oxidase [Actinoplanes ovalisporus]MBM2619547.1 alpha-hydroxy-acid oxidizing protein [Actinoplanes ovalisporus]